MWGVGEVIIIRLIHPILNNLVMDIPDMIGDIVLSLIVVYFIIDLFFTLFSLMEYSKLSYSFQFVPVNFLLEKPSNLLTSTREKAIDKIKVFESFIGKFKFNLNIKNSKHSFSYNSLNNIFKSLKDKLKKD